MSFASSAPRPKTLTKTISLPRMPRECLPIALAFMAIAITFGVTSRQVGLSLLEVFLMSAFVYAGASQMIAVGLIAGGASISAIVLTTFLINLRHLLMSAVLVPSFRHWKPWQRIVFGLQMSDETFAVAANKATEEGKVPQEFAFRVNGYGHFFWVFGSVVGYVCGGTIELSRLGLDYTLIGMLIGLWVLQIKGFRFLILSLLSGGLSLLGVLLGLSTSVSMLLAAMICPTLALVWRKYESR